MAKACDCGFVLEAFERDARLLALPLAVRALWLVLVRRMQGLGQSALLFGSAVPEPREVALLATCTETELETHLEPLLARGLLVRRADGALESPLLAARMKRAETARINGLKGGRPRTRPPGPQQRELLMAVPGGLVGAGSETQEKPSGAAVGSLAKLAEASSKGEAKLAGVPEDWLRIGEAAMEAAGFDPVRWTGHCGMVRTWLQRGASEAVILGVIRRVMARGKGVPQHFGYFDAAINEVLEGRAASPVVEPAAAQVRSPRHAAYLAAMAEWQRHGMIGAAPQLEAA